MYMYIIIYCLSSRETRLSEHVRNFSTIYVDTPISWYCAFVHIIRSFIFDFSKIVREEITIEKLYH